MPEIVTPRDRFTTGSSPPLGGASVGSCLFCLSRRWRDPAERRRLPSAFCFLFSVDYGRWTVDYD